MKVYYLAAIILFILFSCKKENEHSDTFIKYKVNGQQVEIYGELSAITPSASETGVIGEKRLKGNTFLNSFYEIIGQLQSTDIIKLNIPVDSLETKNYHLDSAIYFSSTTAGVQVLFHDTTYSLQRGSDFTDINITSYSSGKMSGTFNCTMSYYNVTTDTYISAIISEGVFQNVKLIYE